MILKVFMFIEMYNFIMLLKEIIFKINVSYSFLSISVSKVTQTHHLKSLDETF